MLPRPTSHSAALGPGVTGPSLAHPGPGTVDVLASNATQYPSAGGKPFVVQPEAHSHAGRPRQHTQCAADLLKPWRAGWSPSTLSAPPVLHNELGALESQS